MAPKLADGSGLRLLAAIWALSQNWFLRQLPVAETRRLLTALTSSAGFLFLIIYDWEGPAALASYVFACTDNPAPAGTYPASTYSSTTAVAIWCLHGLPFFLA